MSTRNDIQARGAIDMSGDPAALASMLRDKCAEAERLRAEVDRLRAESEMYQRMHARLSERIDASELGRFANLLDEDNWGNAAAAVRRAAAEVDRLRAALEELAHNHDSYSEVGRIVRNALENRDD